MEDSKEIKVKEKPTPKDEIVETDEFKVEKFYLKYTGFAIQILGIILFIICMFFDEIRGRPSEFDWLQQLGVSACVLIVLFGYSAKVIFANILKYWRILK